MLPRIALGKLGSQRCAQPILWNHFSRGSRSGVVAQFRSVKYDIIAAVTWQRNAKAVNVFGLEAPVVGGRCERLSPWHHELLHVDTNGVPGMLIIRPRAVHHRAVRKDQYAWAPGQSVRRKLVNARPLGLHKVAYFSKGRKISELVR